METIQRFLSAILSRLIVNHFFRISANSRNKVEYSVLDMKTNAGCRLSHKEATKRWILV